MHQFLTQVQSVAKDNNFFEPDFSLKEMDEIPSIYKSIIDDPATLRDRFKNAESELKKFLVFKILYSSLYKLKKMNSFQALDKFYCSQSLTYG